MRDGRRLPSLTSYYQVSESVNRLQGIIIPSGCRVHVFVFMLPGCRVGYWPRAFCVHKFSILRPDSPRLGWGHGQCSGCGGKGPPFPCPALLTKCTEDETEVELQAVHQNDLQLLFPVPRPCCFLFLNPRIQSLLYPPFPRRLNKRPPSECPAHRGQRGAAVQHDAEGEIPERKTIDF